MSRKKVLTAAVRNVVLFMFAMLGLFHATGQAQAILQAGGASAFAISTGQTELLGPITLVVSSGTTVAGTVEADFFPFTLTNNGTTGISVVGTGGLAGVTFSALADPATVTIRIPAGAGPGSTVTLSGLRVSVAGATVHSLNAGISSTGNAIVAGENLVNVLTGVAEGLLIDDSTSTTTFTYQAGVLSAVSPFVFHEGFPQAFTSTLGVGGQTLPTELIFQVTGIPDNVTVTLPAILTGDSGSTFTTLSGVDEVLTNGMTTNRVTYRFHDSATGAFVADSFSLTPVVGTTGSVTSGTVNMQVTLAPIGAAVPTPDFPSTDIPRFAEKLLPAIGPAPVISRSLYFPDPVGSSPESLVVSNTSTNPAPALFRARALDGTIITGTGITNETTINLTAKQTVTMSLSQIFGAINPATVGSVEVQSSNTALIGASLGTGSQGRFAGDFSTEVVQTYLPFDRPTSAQVPTLALDAAGTAAGTVVVTVSDMNGVTAGLVTLPVNAGGAIRDTVSNLLGVLPGVLPLSGYITVSSTVPVRAILVNNSTGTVDSITAAQPLSQSRIVFPFYAIGGGYDTVLRLVNTSSRSAGNVTITPVQADGTMLPGAIPVVRQLAALSRTDFDFGSLFGGASSALTAGYFAITASPVSDNPFAGLPPLAGSVRVTNGVSASVSPLTNGPGGQFFFTPAVAMPTQFTGLAIVNDGSAPTTVTIDIFAAGGNQLGTATLPLSANGARIQLIQELVTGATGEDGGYVRVSSPGLIDVMGFRGTNNFSELIYLRPQTLP